MAEPRTVRELAAAKGYQLTVIRGGTAFRLWSGAGIVTRPVEDGDRVGYTDKLELKHARAFLRAQPDAVPADQPEQAALL